MIELGDVLTPDSWVVSDHHWGDARRSFDDCWYMRGSWLDRVRPDDVVLHLGDLVVPYARGATDPRSWIAHLSGRKYLILGNLDKEADWYREAGFEVVGRGDRPFYWQSPDGVLVAFSHEPLKTSEHPFDANVHGHIHEGAIWTELYGEAPRANVCVEKTAYAPIRLGRALELALGQAPVANPDHA